jgi:NAD(P)-dependent dehydrogenase (short-subunit alcohol dehydrogenase family)
MNILITGCSTGLGFGLASHYLEEGHKVFGTSRNPNDALMKNDSFSYLSQDLSDFEHLKKSIPEFLSSTKSLDLVILNAGILNEVKDLKVTTIEEIRRVMDVNVWANKVLIDILFESLENVDQLVAISSGAAVSGSRGWNAYALSKATLNMLIDLYSKENATCHFCALAPGLIETGMQDYINDLPDSYQAKFPLVNKLKQARGTEKMPKPKDAAKIVSKSITRALKHPSGSFLDVREM